MPYKRGKYWHIWKRSLIGFGDSGRHSTGLLAVGNDARKLAESMESLLESIALRALTNPDYYRILESYRDGVLSISELYKAHQQGMILDLLAHLTDPLISVAVDDYVTREHDRIVKIGLLDLKEILQSKRISYLRDPKNLLQFLADVQDGKFSRPPIKRNSVRRRHMRAISKLLRYHIGNFERDNVFSDVSFPAEDDSRGIILEIRQIPEFLSQFSGEVKTIVKTAILTGADRNVLFKIKRKHVVIMSNGTEWSAELFLDDRKTKHRQRTVTVVDSLAKEICDLMHNKEPNDTVFNLTVNQFENFWRKGKAEGFNHIRMKDLRHTFTALAERSGMSLSDISATAGHNNTAQTAEYLRKNRAQFDSEKARQIMKLAS